MITRETLELAAKAAGIELGIWSDCANGFAAEHYGWWNPLTDHGQLLDLAMACKIRIDPDANLITWYIPEQMTFRHAGVDCQDFPALAEAVIRAAAEQQLAKGKA